MNITKDLIGKFVTRTKPVFYENGGSDRSYMRDPLKVVGVTETMMYFRHPTLARVFGLDMYLWGKNWEIVNHAPDTGCTHKLAILSKRQYCYDCGAFIGHLSGAL